MAHVKNTIRGQRMLAGPRNASIRAPHLSFKYRWTNTVGDGEPAGHCGGGQKAQEDCDSNAK